MNIQSDLQNSSITLELEPHRAAKTLGECLRGTPEFQNYVQAVRAVNGDLEIQKLSAKMRGHRTALKWATGDKSVHIVELERLEGEMQAYPVYQVYRQAQSEIRALFQSVDRLISQTAGVEFSANAQPSRGCCG